MTNLKNPRKCDRCEGKGFYYYGNSGTYHEGDGMVLRAFWEDFCDKCWGTGDQNNPGVSRLDFDKLKTEVKNLKKKLKQAL